MERYTWLLDDDGQWVSVLGGRLPPVRFSRADIVRAEPSCPWSPDLTEHLRGGGVITWPA